jgi:hypothetical protein
MRKIAKTVESVRGQQTMNMMMMMMMMMMMISFSLFQPKEPKFKYTNGCQLLGSRFIETKYLRLGRCLWGPPVWSEFLATDPEVPGSISDATRFSEK